MYKKILNSSVLIDEQVSVWFFLAYGLDGSIYSYNTHISSFAVTKNMIINTLNNLIQDGSINEDEWEVI